MWLWSSKLMSKSPVQKRGSRDKIMGSKKSENSSIKLIIVTRLVLRVRSTIYYSQCKAWISKIWWRSFGTFKRRFWTKLEFAKNRPKSILLLLFFNLVFLLKCLNGVTNLNVHDFVSFFYLTGVASQGVMGCCSHQAYWVHDFLRLLCYLNSCSCCILYFRFLSGVILFYWYYMSNTQ